MGDRRTQLRVLSGSSIVSWSSTRVVHRFRSSTTVVHRLRSSTLSPVDTCRATSYGLNDCRWGSKLEKRWRQGGSLGCTADVSSPGPAPQVASCLQHASSYMFGLCK